MVVAARRTFFRLSAALLALAMGGVLPGCRPGGGRDYSVRVGDDLKLQLAAQGLESLPPRVPRTDSPLTPGFYARRNYRPAWSDRSGILPQAHDLLSALAESSAEGLDPCRCHWDEVQAMIFQAECGRPSFRRSGTRFAAELDVILTDAFLIYASHLADGMVNPEMSLADGNSPRQGEGLAELLEQALASNQVGPALQSLRPQHEFYLGLRQALRERRERLCGTEETPDTPDERRARPGPDPFRKARTEVQDEIRTIILNMERWRWLPRFLGRRFVLIDVAGFRLSSPRTAGGRCP